MLQLLSDSQIYDIHVATLEVLERIGIVIDECTALKILENAGAYVDHEKRLVRLPPYLVDEGVKKAPKSFILGARNVKYDLHVKRGSIFTRPGSGYTHVIDLETGKFRGGTQKDTADSTRLVDALKNISFCATHILPGDVPTAINDVYAVEIALTNTEKHLFFSPLTYKNFTYSVRMAKVIRGEEEEFRKRPLISFIAATTSPLRIGADVACQLIDCAKYKIPVMLDSSPMCGATGPVTLAGSLVLQSAEDLAMNTLIQLISPNSPVIYGPRCAPIDMRTGLPLWGSVEVGLLSAAGVQIAHHYGLPVDAHGPTTNAKILDEQAGFEKSLCGILPALAGAEVISGAGAMECVTTSSLEQLVIDNEFYGMMFRAIRGINVDAESLAVDVMEKVGPDGNFLGEKHTREHYREEHYLTELFDTKFRSAWEEAGAKGAHQVAKERAKAVLAEHQPAALDKDLQGELEAVLKEAKKEILK